MPYNPTTAAIAEGIITELRKMTTHQYVHIVRYGEITVSNDEGTPIAVLDLDDTIEIWTTNDTDQDGPIGVVARVEYANPDFLDQLWLELHKLDDRIRHRQHQKRLFSP